MPNSNSSFPSDITSQTVLASSKESRDWSTYPSFTVSPSFKLPLSGVSSPTSILNKVVLPAPFGPITPTIPPGGSRKSKSSTSSLLAKALLRLSASITTSPNLGPAGIMIFATSSRLDCCSSNIFS